VRLQKNERSQESVDSNRPSARCLRVLPQYVQHLLLNIMVQNVRRCTDRQFKLALGRDWID
jgi:hypothetical protein